MTELYLLYRELMICLRAYQADAPMPNDNLRRLTVLAGMFEKKINARCDEMHRAAYPEMYDENGRRKSLPAEPKTPYAN